MDKLKEFFDDFSFHARVLPVMTVSIPIVLVLLYKGIVCNDMWDIPLYSTITLIFIVFLSKIAREKGKDYEEKMYKQLGGMPTTIIMRYSDSTIDTITKTRYHKILGKKIGYELPMRQIEEDEESDDLYKSGMTALRNYANNNRASEPRVYQELKDYNYWRNLYGCKWYSVIIYAAIALKEVIWVNYHTP